MAATERKSHKDWFDRAAAKALAAQFAAVDRSFDTKAFVTQCCKGLPGLEFNARVSQFAGAMAFTLPDDYRRAIAVVRRSLPDPLPNCDAVTDGWLQWPVGQFIADYGLQHFDESMDCMLALTQRFSAEFAIRPFVVRYPEPTFEFIYRHTDDKSPHVRRWCSEGTRTRLPWGGNLKALIADPSPILPVLEALKDDSELYVRKSVANSLNDLSKDHPALVVDICRRWSKDSNAGRDWIVKQGLRTLIKQGDVAALKLTGYTAPSRIQSTLALGKKRVKTGDAVELQLTLENASRKKQPLLLDYVVHYKGKSDKPRRKVFKWKSLTLAAGESVTLKKRHSMKQTTIRALYPGKHSVELQLNGQLAASADFVLLA
jgi:3-methyladenine DNA glycosylase AlkC